MSKLSEAFTESITRWLESKGESPVQIDEFYEDVYKTRDSFGNSDQEFYVYVVFINEDGDRNTKIYYGTFGSFVSELIKY